MSKFLCDMELENGTFVGVGVFEVVPERGDIVVYRDTKYLIVGREHDVAESVDDPPDILLIIRNKSVPPRI